MPQTVVLPRQVALISGVVEAGAVLRFYRTGTSTPQAVYTDAALTNAVTSATADSAGVFPKLYYNPNAAFDYRIILENADGVQQPAEDDISRLPATAIEVGAALYPVSEAEDGLGLTSADLDTRYIYGDIRRHRGVGDNATDNTTALRTWASLAGPGMRLTLEADGVYLFTPAGGTEGLLFQNAANFVVEGNGATIKATAGAAVASGCQMMYLRNVQDATFQNFTLDGNRANRTPAEVTAHSLTVSTSCARVAFKKVRSINAVVDGFYIDTQTRTDQATWPTDVSFDRDCSSSNSYRNNMSVINSVRFKAAGRYHGANGTAPEDGIDVEPDAGSGGGNIDTVLDDIDVFDNEGWGISIGRAAGATNTNTRIKVKNIRGSNNGLGFVRLDSATDGEIEDLHCGPHSTATRGLVDLTATAVVNARVRNLNFHDITVSGGSNACVYVHSGVTGRTLIDGVRIENTDCTGLSINKEVDLLNVQILDSIDGAIQVFAANSSLRNVTVDTCTGRGIYIEGTGVEVDGATLIDCASTTASAQWATGSTGGIARNITVRQRTAIPSGAKAIVFTTVPKVVQNITAISAGVDYTAADMFTFTAGIAACHISDCFPSATENSGTGSVASGATTATVNHGLAVTPAAKDFCITFTEQGTNDYGRWWISGISSTQFTVNVSADPGASNLDFAWHVRVRP